jgi:flagellar biosynthesis protein FliR
MNWIDWLQLDNFILFVLTFVRVGSLMVGAPVVGAAQVPLRVRIFLAVAISLVIGPTQFGTLTEMPTSLIGLLVLAAGELIIGLCLGLAMTILFSGVLLAGQLIAQMAGLSMANMVDPFLGEESSVFSQFLYWVAIAVFICLGGPSMIIAALLESFASVPIGANLVSIGLIDALVQMLSTSFLLGFQIAAPVVCALLLSLIILTLIGRTLPQLNILVVGLGLNSILLLAVLAISLGTGILAFQESFEPALATILELFRQSTTGLTGTIQP